MRPRIVGGVSRDAADDQSRDPRLAEERRQTIALAERRGNTMKAADEAREDELLGRVSGHQRERMHWPLLANAIDAPDPLFEACRIPWQLVVDRPTGSDPAG